MNTLTSSSSNSLVNLYDSHSLKVKEALYVLPDESIEEDHKAWSMFNVAGYDVLLYILDRNEIFFEVNGSFSKLEDMPTSVGGIILRTLKQEWEKMLPNLKGEKLYCCSYNEDGQGEYRARMYKKLGFEENPDGYLYYEVGI